MSIQGFIYVDLLINMKSMTKQKSLCEYNHLFTLQDLKIATMQINIHKIKNIGAHELSCSNCPLNFLVESGTKMSRIFI